MINFQYLDLTTAVPIRPETRGKKSKQWVEIKNEGRRETWLFKVGRSKTLENVTEVIASRLAELLGIPCAIYRLAKWNEIEGVASKIIGDEKSTLKLGNEVLATVLPSDYEPDKIRQNRSHTLETIAQALSDCSIPISMQGVVPDYFKAFEAFCGYLLFDAWIANQDRHHENWGVTINDITRLAHSFDHAAALASGISIQERTMRLSTKDQGYGINAFAGRARSAVYSSDPENQARTLLTHEAFISACALSQSDTKSFWLDKLRAIEISQFENELQECPPNILSPQEIAFTVGLLEANKKILLG